MEFRGSSNIKSWIARTSSAKTLSAGVEVSFSFSGFAHEISASDRVYVVDSRDPTILYGWGPVVQVTRDERLVIGDDEEANTPPYPTYHIIGVRMLCKEAFALPLSLSAYLSADDFKAFEDVYGNEYGGVVVPVPGALADKLSRAIGDRRESGAPVFLCYAREDLEVALQLYNRLSDEGLHVWMDKESLKPGQDWKREIARAIRTSGAFIALLSNSSVSKRGFVQKELRIGLEVMDEVPPSRIFLIPVRAEPCDPQHPALTDLHWVDLFPDFDAGFRSLVGAIRSR